MERSSLSFLTWPFFTIVFLNTFLRLDVTVNHTLFLPAHPASPEAMRGDWQCSCQATAVLDVVPRHQLPSVLLFTGSWSPRTSSLHAH